MDKSCTDCHNYNKYEKLCVREIKRAYVKHLDNKKVKLVKCIDARVCPDYDNSPRTGTLDMTLLRLN